MLIKKEIIWREILWQSIEKKVRQFTQKELSKKLDFSLSTVFNALKVPRASNAIEVSGKFFVVRDQEKFLNIWATFRNINKDIIYQTRVEKPITEIEGLMPASVIFTAYSAFRLKFNEAPADYDKIYVYDADLEEIKKRFPSKKGNPNLIVLKPDSELKNYGSTVPLSQIYVDLWNISEWYAKDFLNGLKEKIF
ncbi:MAG: hypothetical protein HZC05_02945 [Candidatus Magasanikbacteria bacterium]|nr:hypothetical protein [Candidatus Magasanikbacteria bacterium]